MSCVLVELDFCRTRICCFPFVNRRVESDLVGEWIDGNYVVGLGAADVVRCLELYGLIGPISVGRTGADLGATRDCEGRGRFVMKCFFIKCAFCKYRVIDMWFSN